MSNFMIQISGDPTVYLSDGFQYRGLSSWEAFLTYRDTFKWPLVVVKDMATLRERAGRDWLADEQGIIAEVQRQATPLFSPDQVARIEAAARAGAEAGLAAGGATLPADVLRQIMDEEAVSWSELQEAIAGANGGKA